jgi:hypothetical protein
VKKRNWTIYVDGQKPFQMVSLDGEIDQAEALACARCIWPKSKLEVE